jgi:dihydroxyacetone kinase
MTRLLNDSTHFAAEALAGFVAQYERVQAVPGGVIRSTRSPAGSVAIIMGGGSGHFPAFAGWVGPGFGHGAACGDVFASPSEQQILSVSRAAHAGGGIVFMPINYAGDILHFSAAAKSLMSEGIDVRMIPITDDIASAGPEERDVRRGIAGAFIVIKMVSAAAERGWAIADIERVAVHANDATRTLGVAFSGCTLPGKAEPLFTLPAGQMGIGLGIHGEAGIYEAPLGTADDIADRIVDGLFEERSPEPGRHVAVLVNGLGTTKYDELFVVFARVRDRLETAGLRLVHPVVGEQVTSLDMAGLSLSLTYLDEELESLWGDAADAYSFSRGIVSRRRTAARKPPEVSPSDGTLVHPGTDESRALSVLLFQAAETTAAALHGAEDRLGALDAVAGDGDHGIGMVRGVTAAVAAAQHALAAGAGAGTLLRRAADAWSDRGGGTSGALWGTGLRAAADVLADERAADASVVVAAVRSFAAAIAERGGATLGDKTMLDAVLPFAERIESELATGEDVWVGWQAAAQDAKVAAERTAAIPARRGRSRTHGERSIGTPDPGAVSFALVVSAVGEGARSR